MGDLPMGEAQDGEPRRDVLLVSLCRSGLLRGRAVISQAVGLDDQVVVGEEEVDLVVEDPMFGQGRGECRCASKGAEENLEVRVRESEGVAVKERAQLLHAGLARVGVEAGAKRLRVDQVELVGLVHRPLQP
jgi:hypothetical protein